MQNQPWLSGPIELLWHARQHLDTGSELDLRIVMISIDNAVEAAMQAYIKYRLHLDEDAKDYEFRKKLRYFPGKLEIIETHMRGTTRINYPEIRFFHEIRNKLYHEGNGLTVEQTKAAKYYRVAKKFIRAMFQVNVEGMIKAKEQEEMAKDSNAHLRYHTQLKRLVQLGVPIEEFFQHMIRKSADISNRTMPQLQKTMVDLVNSVKEGLSRTQKTKKGAKKNNYSR